MNFIKFSLLSALLLLAAVGTQAQDRTVRGKVLGVDGAPLPGAAVLIPGTSRGAVTDAGGLFSLSVPEGEAVLTVQSLGYVSKEVRVPVGKEYVQVVLEEDAMTLAETVVVGYGTQKKVNLTGAVTSVEAGQLEKRTAGDLSVMLQGAVPGLNVATSSGKPGSYGSLNIRGYTSINGAGPMVLIDGADGDIHMVNPNDVESISVIKDAAAAAVYGARAAFGVILVTTKSGKSGAGKARVRYSGRFGWAEPTTSTDYETRGYWAVYAMNKFKNATDGAPYIKYNDYDMAQLLLRVNDKTEHPDRPWVVLENRDGRDQWFYYGNNDWWHLLFNDRHPQQQHSVSVSGGGKGVRYFVSGGFNRDQGILRMHPDVFHKFNLRSKIDIDISKYIKFSNNTSFYGSSYKYIGVGDEEDVIAYSAAHALPIFPMKNPDGSWLSASHHLNGSYKVGNGRHIILSQENNRNVEDMTSFANTSELTLTPFRNFTVVGNFTYRFKQSRELHRKTNMYFRDYPGEALKVYNTGAGENCLVEGVGTRHYYSANLFGTYENTFASAHHLKAMLGGNYETSLRKSMSAEAKNILVDNLSDFDLTGVNKDGEAIQLVQGGFTEYALLGFFGRLNYDYKGRYLFETSGRYDGTSRFGRGHRWGFFPSVSAGWRISEEPFFASCRAVVDNLKLRASFGSLGNQKVSDYQYIRTISLKDFKTFGFGEPVPGKYAQLSAPNAADLTWERSEQYNVGLDFSAFQSRLQLTVEGYVRDTKDMLTDGLQLPSVYGAAVPKANSADLRTKGYELSLVWKDRFQLAGRPFGWSLGGTLSRYESEITKFDNKERTFAKKYYVGQKLGDLWGFVTDGLFRTDEEAAAYAAQVDLAYVSGKLPDGWKGGDLKYVDLDGDHKIGIGANSADDPGDRRILGNKYPRLQYGFTFSADWNGFDLSVFFQGTGNHYWYPSGYSFLFWGPYSQPMISYLPRDFMDEVWDYDRTDAYFPRARAYTAYSANTYLSMTNDRYLQNIRYLRLKNLSVGYTLPEKLTARAGIEKVRLYFSGENLAYWSPLRRNSRYIDPEGAYVSRSKSNNRAFYPWQKTCMFGVDVTF